MQIVRNFLKSTKDYPLLTALAAGLYPVFFYYTNNFTLVNTWKHFGYFCLMFVLVPVVLIFVAYRISGWSFLKKFQKYVLPFLNMFVFLFLMKVSLYAGLQKKMTLAILIVAALFAFFLYKHYKKAVVFQLLLAAIGFVTFSATVISQLNFSSEWMKQPDDIASVQFKKKPNVYFIQPDGYMNFSKIGKGYYEIDNTVFEQFLLDHNFTNYADFRSNYGSTLSSNSSAFMMKHHFYNRGTSFSEGLNARNVIISNNTVLDAFNNNGYKTYFVSEKPYLLLNRPKIGFDEANFSYDDIPYISSGLKLSRDVQENLDEYISEPGSEPRFFFIEIFNPGHISNNKLKSGGVEVEKELWKDSLVRANGKLTKMVNLIKEKDPNALILIMADHGGFVGLENATQAYHKTEDPDLIDSMFGAQLSIHWPNGERPSYEDKLKSNVNVFRILFAYLSDNQKYLQHLQDNSSYMIIYKGAPKGIYQYFDDNGNHTFNKH